MAFIYAKSIKGGGPNQFEAICETTAERTAAAGAAVTTAQGLRIRLGTGSLVKDLQDGGLYILGSNGSWAEVS